LSILYSYCA